MRKVLLFIVFAVVSTTAGWSQTQSGLETGDPHIRVVDFVPDQVVLVEGAPGYQVTLQLAPDEQVESVALGDSSAWSVTANRRGDHLFIKALAAGVLTNMTVITSGRLYNFELAPPAGGSAEMAYTVRFRYPRGPVSPEGIITGQSVVGRYHLRGDKALKPSVILDNGSRTYIRWPRERSLPAVYAISESGQEMLVNGMMREDDTFVIDSVWSKLVFRLDRSLASATRRRPRR